jgi:hypothetical protein
MTTDFTHQLNLLRTGQIGSEKVKAWKEQWQRIAEAEGLIVRKEGTVRIIEPAIDYAAADMAETLVRLDEMCG